MPVSRPMPCGTIGTIGIPAGVRAKADQGRNQRGWINPALQKINSPPESPTRSTVSSSAADLRG